MSGLKSILLNYFSYELINFNSFILSFTYFIGIHLVTDKKVFIDTQAFVKAGLHFDSPAFRLFVKYCEQAELYHVTTSVVKREVLSKIQSSVKEAISSIQTFRRKAKILSLLDNDKIKGLFGVIPDQDIFDKSEEVFNEFMRACRTQVVQADGINAEELLSLYFEQRPPFDEKKKTEFPDAISLLSLRSHLSNGEKIYVVSDDGDMKAYCAVNPDFISVDSLEKLLDIYTTHTNGRHEKVRQFVINNRDALKQRVSEYLEGCEVYNSSSWEDAEVDGGLRVIELGEIKPSILYIDDDESHISFDIDVKFEVDVVGPDFNNGTYDREEGRMYTFEETSKTAVISRSFTVEWGLNYDFVDGELANIEDIGIWIEKVSEGIEVCVEENDEDWR